MTRGRYFRGFWRILGSTAGVIFNPLLHLILPEARRMPVVRSFELTSLWWPKSLDGYRIAFASDLHLNDDAHARKLLAVTVERLTALRPHLILLGGDLVNSVFPATNLPADEYSEQLARLTAPDGVFAVYGNHDLRLGKARVRHILESAGIRPLNNRCIRIKSRLGGEFRLAGFAAKPPKRAVIRKVLRKKRDIEPVIALSHMPEIFPRLPRKVRLLLAGHTHGGQVRLPGIGSPVAGTALGCKVNYGMTRDAGKTMIVSGGVGTANLDLRFRCPPEILCVTLNHITRGDASWQA